MIHWLQLLCNVLVYLCKQYSVHRSMQLPIMGRGFTATSPHPSSLTELDHRPGPGESVPWSFYIDKGRNLPGHDDQPRGTNSQEFSHHPSTLDRLPLA